MPGSRANRITNLTADNLARLAERDDCIVMQPTHDTLFEPWPAARVRECVTRIVAIARNAPSEDEARVRVRAADPNGEFKEFESKYQLMFTRLTQPEIARNKGHVEIVLGMIGLRERMDQGTLTEAGAQRLVSEQALANLMAQAQNNQQAQSE